MFLMCTFENKLRFLHFSIALDMSRITHFLSEIMSPKNSASGSFLTFSMFGLIMRGEWKAFCEKSPLGGLDRDQKGFVIFKISVHAFCNRCFYDFCYLAIHIKLQSYFFLFFKILICFGYFPDSVNIAGDYEYSFFSSVCQC